MPKMKISITDAWYDYLAEVEEDYKFADMVDAIMDNDAHELKNRLTKGWVQYLNEGRRNGYEYYQPGTELPNV